MDKRKRRLLCMLEGSGRKSRWISGVPPLSFRAQAAGTLENYRIYGNTVGGESVGDLVTSGQHAGEYKVDVTVSNGTDTLTTPIYLPEQMRKFGDYSDYADYEKQKVIKRVGHTVFTSASGWSQEMYHNFYYDIAVSSIISQLIRTNRVESTFLGVRPDFDENNCFISGTGKINVWLPEIDSLSEFQDWLNEEPFIVDYGIENTDLDVTLPELPTLAGTNVLSVGTEVQPSRVEVKGRIKAVGQETEPEP